MTFFSPLEQFELVVYIPFIVDSFFDFSFTNSALAIFLSFISTVILIKAVGKGFVVPSRWQSILEEFYLIVFGIIQNVLSRKHAVKFFPIVLTFAIVIFICNLLGMAPYSFAITSHLVVTIFLALTIFIPITFLGIRTHKIRFWGFFLPAGCPLLLVPLLVPIELVVYCFRVISLSVRLFANIMAGHILLKVLAGFAWGMFQGSDIFLFGLHIVPVFVVFGLFGLELGVAFIQTYVWTMLLCIYLNDAINLH